MDSVSVPWLDPQSAYIHVPFCAHRCGYCDFAIAVNQEHSIELYLDALTAELATLGEPRPVNTIFVGGGTPTLLSPAQLNRLLQSILHWLPLNHSEIMQRTTNHEPRTNGEFSIEANPGTLNADKVAVLADHGINRVSLGAQSFQPHLLRALERDHVPDDVPRAVDCVRQRIHNISLDLIFGIPGQTLGDWQTDLAQALALEPDHVSTYGLTYEKGTPLWKDWQRGRVVPVPEEAELAMYSHAIDTLTSAGFEHYEISSFARPGRRCRHNEVYWANYAHYGFGMGAARYVGGKRELNTRDLKGYIRKALAGEPTAFQSEHLADHERARETIAQNLRRAEGINRRQFFQQTGFPLDDLAGAAIGRHGAVGLLESDDQRVMLTRSGKYVADSVIASLL
ncbi:MAG: radical SAM family heme chaperone HemW [Gemmataceae bacterium]